MNLPNLSKPVNRNQIVNANNVSGVNPSDLACTACCAAANLLPWPLSTAAKAACGLMSGCSC